jgi:hypothetical protein
MASVVEMKAPAYWPRLAAWLPLAILPPVVAWLAADWPAWAFMWTLAISIYGACKWLTLCHALDRSAPTLGRSLVYLFLWPGMDARQFLDAARCTHGPGAIEWCAAIGKAALGVGLMALAASLVDPYPTAAACIGIVGIAFTLHFGLFHLLSVIWRRRGIEAPPIMNAPILASSLGDFWGRRWNLAFRDLAHAFIFRPLVRRTGPAAAMLAAFLVSGVIHDAVISIPARGGYGLPTLYFAIQGLGVLFERRRFGKFLGTHRERDPAPGRVPSGCGRLFAAAVTLAPVCLLFHRPFLENVLVPMLGG